MKTRNAQEIKDRYNTVKNDIANLLGFFECELTKEKPILDWSSIGTLQKVRGDLIPRWHLSAGFPNQINDTLETRNDSQTHNRKPKGPNDEVPSDRVKLHEAIEHAVATGGTPSTSTGKPRGQRSRTLTG